MLSRWLVLSLLLASCAGQSPHLYMLDGVEAPPYRGIRQPMTIALGEPGARAGYDTPDMAYTTKPHEIRYFSRNRWIAPPAKMLQPILSDALSKRFDQVVDAPAAAGLRLDSEIVLFRQEFSGGSSRFHLVVKARLGRGDNRTFDVSEPCASNDPYGGVLAANSAIAEVSRRIADYALEAAQSRRRGE